MEFLDLVDTWRFRNPKDIIHITKISYIDEESLLKLRCGETREIGGLT